MDPINPVAGSPEAINQTPVSQSPKIKNLLVLIMSILLIITVTIAGLFYFQIQKLSKELAKYQTQASSTPTATSDPTADWKMYTVTTDPALNLANYQIKLPPAWIRIEHSSNFQNKEIFQDSYTNQAYQLILNQEKNINPQTSKPYITLRELTRLNYDVQSLMVAGQTAAQVLPRAGSETNFMVLFFSQDNKLTFSIELDTPQDGSRTQEGKILFDQILSTFKFLDQKGCTKDAKICPDGSSVGRIRPTCEFAPCPTP